MNIRSTLLYLVFTSMIALSPAGRCIAQTTEEFEPVPAPKSERSESNTDELDKIRQNLTGLKARTAEEREQFMKLHKTLSNGYASKGHYKQAVDEYAAYLDLKEQLFQKELQETVSKASSSMRERSDKLEQDLKAAAEEAESATASVERYDTFRMIYQQFFSIGLVALTVVFALSFVRSGVRMSNRRKETRELRNRLLGMHRTALAGRLSNGIRMGHRDSLSRLSKEALDLGKQVSASGSSAGSLLEKLGKELGGNYSPN
ncbi:MAG: hypothetical protein RL021_324 [Bacteroidota bacterium]